MSIPSEKMRAVVYAEEFLDGLIRMRCKDIGRHAADLRKRALRVLHHWPMLHDYQAMLRGLYRADPAGAEVSDQIELLIKEFADGFERRRDLPSVQRDNPHTCRSERPAQVRVRRIRRGHRNS